MSPQVIRAGLVTALVASGLCASLGVAPASGADDDSCMPSIRLSLVEGAANVNRVRFMVEGCSTARYDYAIGSEKGTLDTAGGRFADGEVTVGCNKTITGTIDEVDGPGYDQETVTTGFLTPYAPKAPSLVEATPTTLRAAWVADVDACHPIDSFVLQSSSGASLNVVDAAATLTGLAPSTTYGLTVVAVNARGRTTGPTASMKTAAAPVVKPTEPTGLSASGIQPTSARLTWTTPSSAGTSPVTGYIVTVNGTSLGGVTGLFRDLTGLAPNTFYLATVAAVSASGPGPSASVTFRTAAAPSPVAPTPVAPVVPVPVLAQQTIAVQTAGPAWRSGKAHVVGALTTNAGTPVTWKATGAGVKSVKQTVKAGKAALVITLKPGRKSARVTITGSAPVTASHAAVTSSKRVTIKR